MARVLSMWIDAKTDDDKETVLWARRMLEAQILGTKPPEKEKEPAAIWDFGK